MSTLAFRSVLSVQRRWGAAEEDMHHSRRRLAAVDPVALPAPVQAVAGVFLTTWSGYAEESADLAAGFILALSAADFVFHDTDGYVAEQFLHLDGRLGWAR